MVTCKLDETASGVYTISATPFADNDDLGLNSTQHLTDFYLEKGVSGITILGMMGEAQKLSVQEAGHLLSYVLTRVDGRLPILVGVSNADLINWSGQPGNGQRGCRCNGSSAQWTRNREEDLRLFLSAL